MDWASAGASLIAGWMAQEGQEDTNHANAELAREQMAFQERMSSTAHQRETQDLIAAGLNPMISAMKSGASTPSGAMATMQNAAGAGVDAATKTMSSASQATAIEQTKALIDKTKAETALIESQTPEAAARITNLTSSAGHLDTVSANIRQEMTAFTTRWEKLREEIEQLRVQQRQGDSQTDLNVQMHNIIRPAELAKLQAEAKKLTHEATLAGLKIPEGLAEAAFWKGPQKDVATHYRHAPSASHFIPGTITKGAEMLDRATTSAGQSVSNAWKKAREAVPNFYRRRQ